MATYCYRCTACEATAQLHLRDLTYCHKCAGQTMVRDYRAENAGIAVEGLKQEREMGAEARKRLFLPHNDDFKGPSDPDGSKGMREWRDTHQPKNGNKAPDWPGTVEKKVY